jgi:hypothetical protein
MLSHNNKLTCCCCDCCLIAAHCVCGALSRLQRVQQPIGLLTSSSELSCAAQLCIRACWRTTSPYLRHSVHG